jgi:hypothetical protein
MILDTHFLIVFFAIGIIGFIIGKISWSNVINNIKRKKEVKNEVSESEDLVFLNQYTYYGGYSSEEKLKNISLYSLLIKFRNNNNTSDSVVISSKFKGVYYAMLDLDDNDKYELFKKIYSSTPYAIFSSSPDHYWGFLDIPYARISDIYLDTNWKVCNDSNYVSYTKRRENILIRGLYEDLSRKPRLNETNGNLSKNFQLFIDKLSMYYNKEGLELSVLKFKDPNLLIQYNRKKKLQQLNKSDEEVC